MITLMLLAALQGAPPPAAAPTTPVAPVTVPGARKTLDPNERVCHKDTATGHLISGTTCHTRAEWENMELRAKSDMEDRFRRGGCVPGAGC